MVIETILKMRADGDFKAFYETTTNDTEKIQKIYKPKLPRKRKQTKNYLYMSHILVMKMRVKPIIPKLQRNIGVYLSLTFKEIR